MIVLIILTVFSLVILTLGFLGIKLPFLSSHDKVKKELPSTEQKSPHIEDKLIKNSVDKTLRNTKFFRKKVNEKSAGF